MTVLPGGEDTHADYDAMPLQYAESRRGRRGRSVTPERIRRMLDIVEVIAKQTIAITATKEAEESERTILTTMIASTEGDQ